ncbi:MAG: electron transfer flavoprotein subunit alpha [Syntrophobacter sp. DG_60]|nr:MAG: electron transfer flavoprotein subunit alpha [Syntrophobacter sp. DG_60]
MARDVWIIAEQIGGQIRKVTYELIGEGKRLAGELSEKVCAVLLGYKVRGLANSMAHYGADKVFVADEPNLEKYTADAYVPIIVDLVKVHEPSILLMGSTFQGKDLGAWLAAKLKTGLATDCVEFRIEDNNLLVKRPVYGGKAFLEVVCKKTRPQMALVRSGVFKVPPPDESKTAEVFNVDVELDPSSLKTKVLDVSLTGKMDVTEADILVSGGMGMGSPRVAGFSKDKPAENFYILENLAELLGGTTSCSRLVADAGWRPGAEHVGLTGKQVAPTLYIACGLSGAIQHLAGIVAARYVVAINIDPEAPIFKRANWGIVGDLFEVVPTLIEEIKKVKG